MQSEDLWPMWPTQFPAPRSVPASYNTQLKFRVGTRNDTEEFYVFKRQADGSILSYNNMMRQQDIYSSRVNHKDLPVQKANRFNVPITRDDILACVVPEHRINMINPPDTNPRFGPSGLTGWNSGG